MERLRTRRKEYENDTQRTHKQAKGSAPRDRRKPAGSQEKEGGVTINRHASLIRNNHPFGGWGYKLNNSLT